jgi:RecA-family ATPase
MSVRLDPNAPDGFVVHSFASDDAIECRDYIREKCGLPAFGNGHNSVPVPDAPPITPLTNEMISAALAKASAPPARSNTKITATYDYTDEKGNLLYQVCRLEPKSFRQRRPDSNGGWTWNLNGPHRVPYRLPDLLKFNFGTVFIPEGEKDADRLAGLDLVATTAASGKWDGIDLSVFTGRDCLVLEDNDPAGSKKSLDIAQKLHGIAGSVRIVRLPGLPDRGDVSDWLDANWNDVGRLVELCFDFPLWTPTQGVSDTGPVEKSEPVTSVEARAETDAPILPVSSLSALLATVSAASTAPATPPPSSLPPPLPFVNMSNWDNEPVPEQEWAVFNRIPLKQCVLFSGEGAAGKSTLFLQQSAAHVVARDWLGTMLEPGPAIYIDAEDDEKVMHRRLAAITDHYHVAFSDLVKGGLHLISLVGHDAVLAAAGRNGKIEPTPLYKQLIEAAGDIRPVIMGIASSANVYAGSEIDRSQVQQFISLLTRLAITASGSVVLIGHPSLTGLNTDTGLSGTTQWHNAVRARFYLKSVKPEDGEQPDTDLRELVFKKNNYGAVSESIVLRYSNGLFLPLPGITSLDRAAQELKAEEVFIDLLRAFTNQNRHVSDKAGSAYAPALFAREPLAKAAGLTNKALAAAMSRLFAAVKIWNEPCGRPSRPQYRIALKV